MDRRAHTRPDATPHPQADKKAQYYTPWTTTPPLPRAEKGCRGGYTEAGEGAHARSRAPVYGRRHILCIQLGLSSRRAWSHWGGGGQSSEAQLGSSDLCTSRVSYHPAQPHIAKPGRHHNYCLTTHRLWKYGTTRLGAAALPKHESRRTGGWDALAAPRHEPIAVLNASCPRKTWTRPTYRPQWSHRPPHLGSARLNRY